MTGRMEVMGHQVTCPSRKSGKRTHDCIEISNSAILSSLGFSQWKDRRLRKGATGQSWGTIQGAWNKDHYGKTPPPGHGNPFKLLRSPSL